MQGVFTNSDPLRLHATKGLFVCPRMDLSDYSDEQLRAELAKRQQSPFLNGFALDVSPHTPLLNPTSLKPTPDGGFKRRKPKNREELVSYCLSLGLPESDAEHMWKHWQSNGFTINSKPIKNWKAVIRTWKDGGFFPSQRHSKQPTHDCLGRFLGERTTDCLGHAIRPPPPSLSEEEFMRRMGRLK